MPLDWSPLWLSLRVAGLATILSLALALWLAYLLANREFRAKPAVEIAVTALLALPSPILATYLLLSLNHRPELFTWQVAVAAGFFYAFPALVRAARAAFQGGGARFENAARSLGAAEWRVFWWVSLPLAFRPILAATALAFARMLAEFVLTRVAARAIVPFMALFALAAIYGAWRLEVRRAGA